MRDSRVLPGCGEVAGRPAPGDRAGQPRRLRRLRPRPARVGPQGHRDLRPDDGRRRGVRARGHHPPGHLRRPGEAAHDRRRPHVQHLQPLPAAQLRRDRAAVAVLVADSPRRLRAVGPRRPQPALRALAAPAGRRRLQRLVQLPDPARSCSSRSACRCRCSSSGTTPSSGCAPRRPASRLCPSRAPRSGTSRGPTRTTTSTGSPTSTSATASSPRCSTRRTPRAGGWCASRSTTRSSIWCRCSTPPSSCGTVPSRTSWPVPTHCTASCRPSSPRSTPSPSSSPTCSSRPTATPCRPSAARSRPSGARRTPRSPAVSPS